MPFGLLPIPIDGDEEHPEV